MLDLTGQAGPAKRPIARTIASTVTGPTLAELQTHVASRTDLSATTRARYLTAIEKGGERLNKPLGMIPAELALVEERFPLTGFDPEHWSSHTAYTLFRRRLQAALREFLGVHAEQARLRAMQDDWSRLLAAITPLTEGKVGQGVRWHPMKLAALKAFALVARAQGWQPRDLDLARARQLDEMYQGNKREANRRALARLDELRQFPELTHWLPPHPIGFTPDTRVPELTPIASSWKAQIGAWVDALTKSGWDPVTQSFADDHQGHAHVLRSALRTTLRIALEKGLVSPHTEDLTPLLADDEAICTLAGEMFARRHRSKRTGHLEPRTARKYLKGLNQLRAQLGIDTSLLCQVLANNKDAREGKKTDRRMTPKNRGFCESLIDKKALRKRFLTSYEVLRAEAENLLAQALSEQRALTGHERARVRLLGASACFAAIEIGGAPIRVDNAMQLTCIGEDAQIRLPKAPRKPIKVLIPAEHTKNKAEIAFPIRTNAYGCHDTILWYAAVIRPLFAHAETSPYLFPAVTVPGAPLNADYFGAEFSALMRSVVNLPMTPHQMRHGQTSLLLDRHPNEIEVIAKRIDDTPGTLRQYYGWLNALKLVERGQDLLVELMHE
ncbi:hypothetical protein T8T21_16130 (plasmid) [Limimaricola variabilis]|uniref:hypothetical protein n=1 Tax=Limimaricola variabilis TaxID=1492771 RepID=UPI002AC92323|nr:hypothetical protein [Limimaricola variabilis]WPY96301.1 hypothetical protein T8T21_16130 [Limimaricola variabilis]